MIDDFPLFPEAASTIANDVDRLFWFVTLVTGAACVLVLILVVFFALKYRRTPENQVPKHEPENKYLEYSWIVIPFIAFMIMYFWGAQVYFKIYRPPEDALEVWGTGKQWMWKFQHVGGQSEINELHVPVGRPVKMILSSEDVIHSFYLPSMRVKRDVLPNRYTTVSFEPNKPGRYHLFCAEYCGTEHSRMIGSVVVLPQAEYQTWLAGGESLSPVQQGEQLFTSLGCITCHAAEGPGARGPELANVFGSQVLLRGGGTVLADENYLRESMLDPAAKLVAGYDPIMPSFEGQVDEQQLIYLITYIKSLGGEAVEPEGLAAPAAPDPAAVENVAPSDSLTPEGATR